MEINIKLAQKEDTNRLVELLNAVTLHLHEKNINQWTYPWNTEEINKDVKDENIYIITFGNLLIGTFSLKPTDISSLNSIIKEEGFYLYRIAVLPEYQGKNIGLDAIAYAREMADFYKKPLYLDCWAGNKVLKNFYSNAGFKFLGDFPEEDYSISVYCLS